MNVKDFGVVRGKAQERITGKVLVQDQGPSARPSMISIEDSYLQTKVNDLDARPDLRVRIGSNTLLVSNGGPDLEAAPVVVSVPLGLGNPSKNSKPGERPTFDRTFDGHPIREVRVDYSERGAKVYFNGKGALAFEQLTGEIEPDEPPASFQGRRRVDLEATLAQPDIQAALGHPRFKKVQETLKADQEAVLNAVASLARLEQSRDTLELEYLLARSDSDFQAATTLVLKRALQLSLNEVRNESKTTPPTANSRRAARGKAERLLLG